MTKIVVSMQSDTNRKKTGRVGSQKVRAIWLIGAMNLPLNDDGPMP